MPTLLPRTLIRRAATGLTLSALLTLSSQPAALAATSRATPGQAPAGLSVADWDTIQAQLSAGPYLKASNTNAGDYFGYAVAVSGNTVVVGARGESSNAPGVNGNQNDNSVSSAGAVYVFVKTGNTWSQQAYLKSASPDSHDEFGASLAIEGDTLAVGDWSDDSGSVGVNGNPADDTMPGAGSVYIFARSGSTWSQQAYLKASNPDQQDSFGISVALSGNTLVVGAEAEDSGATGVGGNQADNSAIDSGAAYVFVRNGTTWSQQAYLKASNTAAGDAFGHSVGLSGDLVVVGAAREDSNATSINGNQADNSATDAGAAYAFSRSGSTWTQQAYLKASDARAGDSFGGSIGVSGDTAVVGAEGAGDLAGQAYVLVRSGTTWSQQALLTPSNAEHADLFGYRVAISGDTVVVSSYYESSGATGVDGNSANNDATWSGAAYVFARSGATWSQQHYLKATNTEAFDHFGTGVAVSGVTIVVGADTEDSNATGVNGNGADNSMAYSGAAYVFEAPLDHSLFIPALAK